MKRASVTRHGSYRHHDVHAISQPRVFVSNQPVEGTPADYMNGDPVQGSISLARQPANGDQLIFTAGRGVQHSKIIYTSHGPIGCPHITNTQSVPTTDLQKPPQAIYTRSILKPTSEQETQIFYMPAGEQHIQVLYPQNVQRPGPQEQSQLVFTQVDPQPATPTSIAYPNNVIISTPIVEQQHTTGPEVLEHIQPISGSEVIEYVQHSSDPQVIEHVQPISGSQVIEYVQHSSDPQVIEHVQPISGSQVIEYVQHSSDTQAIEHVQPISGPQVIEYVPANTGPQEIEHVQPISGPQVIEYVQHSSDPQVMEYVQPISGSQVIEYVQHSSDTQEI